MIQELADHRFSGSIISYPDRGPWGNAGYHGNCSGYVVRDFLATYHPSTASLFCDPMEGSRTSREVAATFGIRYEGRDLRDGFDIVRDDLLTSLGEPCSTIWAHPPYASMVQYSGTEWGDAQHPSDLSSAGRNIDAFTEMLASALANIYRALEPGGHYAVLLAPWRTGGAYFDLPTIARTAAPGSLVSELIKVQHNVRSAARSYSGSFVRIAHETMLVYRRAADGGIFAVTLDALARLTRQHTATWKNLVAGYVRENGGQATLQELYGAFDRHPKAATNANVKEKLRQIVQDERTFVRLSRGRYGITAA